MIVVEDITTDLMNVMIAVRMIAVKMIAVKMTGIMNEVDLKMLKKNVSNQIKVDLGKKKMS